MENELLLGNGQKAQLDSRQPMRHRQETHCLPVYRCRRHIRAVSGLKSIRCHPTQLLALAAHPAKLNTQSNAVHSVDCLINPCPVLDCLCHSLGGFHCRRLLAIMNSKCIKRGLKLSLRFGWLESNIQPVTERFENELIVSFSLQIRAIAV